MNCVRGVLACSMLLALFAAAPKSARAEEAGKRIAVVNVSRVFKAYTRVEDVQKKMEQLFEPDRKAIEKESKDLKNEEDLIRSSYKDPKKDVEFFRQIQHFEMHKMEVDLKFQELYQRVEDKRRDEMKLVLNEIKSAIRLVGVQEKFDLIMRAPEFDDEFDEKKPADGSAAKPDEPKTAGDLVRRFRENPVMYFSQGVEVTDKVIAKLNEDYKNVLDKGK